MGFEVLNNGILGLAWVSISVGKHNNPVMQSKIQALLGFETFCWALCVIPIWGCFNSGLPGFVWHVIELRFAFTLQPGEALFHGEKKQWG